MSYREARDPRDTEIERLRRELASLLSEELHPPSDWHSPCRKCKAPCCKPTPKGADASDLRYHGVLRDHEPATRRVWWKPWRAPAPERMRIRCRYCGAVYYERPSDSVEGDEAT